MATKLSTIGSTTDLGHSPDLAKLQEAVGGYIEGVQLDPRCGYSFMYVNEEGLLQGLQINPEASLMAGRPIVGDVVLLSQAELEEEMDG
jgi:hypothetical protein